jgi:hypothetical protein
MSGGPVRGPGLAGLPGNQPIGAFMGRGGPQAPPIRPTGGGSPPLMPPTMQPPWQRIPDMSSPILPPSMSGIDASGGMSSSNMRGGMGSPPIVAPRPVDAGYGVGPLDANGFQQQAPGGGGPSPQFRPPSAGSGSADPFQISTGKIMGQPSPGPLGPPVKQGGGAPPIFGGGPVSGGQMTSTQPFAVPPRRKKPMGGA